MQRLIEMIDFLTPYKVTSENTLVSEPRANIGAQNTSVILQGKLSTGHYGKRNFKYNRINLSGFVERSLVWTNETNVHQLLKQINQVVLFTYTLSDADETIVRQGQLELSDIVNDTFTMSAGTQKSIKLRADPRSYLFIGEYKVKLIG